MRRSTKPIVIASRRSTLARTQAQMVGKALSRLHPKIEVRYLWIESQADRTPGSLAHAGGKGLFARAIEDALLCGDADLAVHSLKDLPASDAERTPRLTLAAIPKRGDPHDCLVARDGAATLDALPPGAVVGTSSPRRAAQVLRARPDLRIRLMRGNVDSRVKNVLDPGGATRFDAALLAAAGLRRLGMKALAQQAIHLDVILPAACQGALAVQCRSDDHVSLTRCLPLNHAATATAVHAERGLVAAVGADCHSPIAVFAEPVAPEKTPAKRNADAHWFALHVRVLSADGSQVLEMADQVKTQRLRWLVKQFAKELQTRGVAELLASAQDSPIWATTAQAPLPTPASAAG